MRPYKGIDVLLDAWRAADLDAELWIVGMPRMDIAPLRAAAPPSVRWVPRFVPTTRSPRTSAAPTSSCCPTARSTSPACCSRRSRSARRCCSAPSAASRRSPAHGAAALVAPGDPAALAGSCARLLGDDALRARGSPPARAPRRPGAYSWDAIAAAHLELYGALR